MTSRKYVAEKPQQSGQGGNSPMKRQLDKESNRMARLSTASSKADTDGYQETAFVMLNEQLYRPVYAPNVCLRIPEGHRPLIQTRNPSENRQPNIAVVCQLRKKSAPNTLPRSFQYVALDSSFQLQPASPKHKTCSHGLLCQRCLPRQPAANRT